MINVAKDVSLAGCGLGSWDLFFSIASDAAQLSGICTPAGSNHYYRDGIYDIYDFNLFDDPAGLLSGEHDDSANCYTHYADYPSLHGVGLNDSLPNIQGVWSTTAAVASTLSTTGYDSAGWSGIVNARQEDETWATIQPSGVENAPGILPNWAGTEYIVLTGYGFNIPVDAAIVSIVAAMKGYGYSSTDRTRPFGFHFSGYYYTPFGGVFNAGLMSNGILYPFADPSTIVPYGSHPLPFPTAHAGPPWPNDPGVSYIHGVTVGSGMWTQARGANWPVVIDPSWYPTPNPNVALPTIPFQSSVGIKPLVLPLPLGNSQGPLFLGDLVGCPRPFGHNGPVQKNMNLTPTKQVWTPAEVNDPSFGAALSVWSTSINDHNAGDGSTDVYQSYMFLNCIGIGVYYTPGTGGGGVGTRDMRPRVWIST